MAIYHSRDCRYSPLFPHCNCGATEDDEELERLRVEATAMYDKGYADGSEDSGPSDVWVILHDDDWTPDGTGMHQTFHSVVGSEFAAQETIDALNVPGCWGHYYYKQVTVESV